MTTPKKVSELAALVVPAAEDLLLIVDDPSVDPASKKITFGNLTRDITSNNITTNNELVLTSLSVGNGVSNSTLSSSALRIGGSSVNTAVTSTAIRIGNSTVNTVIASTLLTTPSLLLSNTTNEPANNATGTAGEIRVTDSAIYVCVATNSWKKVDLINYS